MRVRSRVVGLLHGHGAADRAAASLLHGQQVRVAGRLGPVRDGPPAVAVLTLTRPPAPVGRPPPLQTAAGDLRAGLRRAVDRLPPDERGLLPGLVLATYTIGLLLRFTRASVLEILGNDYVRAARAKGLPERVVILRHVLRPALVSIITVAGVAFGSLLSGAVLVENIFSWPGLGYLTFQGLSAPDLPLLQGTFVVFSSIVTGAMPASSLEWIAQPITVSSTVVRIPPCTAPSAL